MGDGVAPWTGLFELGFTLFLGKAKEEANVGVGSFLEVSKHGDSCWIEVA